jgi:UDP-3-O-[3-hydroxymyristoyl] glucosamine N-acyltransferase
VRLLGFLDDDPDRHGAEVAGLPVLGGVDWLTRRDDVAVVPAIGSPARRAALLARLVALGVPLATVVHPSATVGPRTTIAAGAIVCPAVVLTCDVRIGRGAIVNYGAMIGHDGVVGEAAFIAPGAISRARSRSGRRPTWVSARR